MDGLDQFALGVVGGCVFVMRGVGAVDDLFSAVLSSIGLTDSYWQFVVLLAVLACCVVLALRAVGGLLGWAVLLFAVLLLLHHAVPSLSAPDMPVSSQLKDVL